MITYDRRWARHSTSGISEENSQSRLLDPFAIATVLHPKLTAHWFVGKVSLNSTFVKRLLLPQFHNSTSYTSHDLNASHSYYFQEWREYLIQFPNAIFHSICGCSLMASTKKLRCAIMKICFEFLSGFLMQLVFITLSLSESSKCLQPRWPLRSYNHQLFFTVWSWVSWCQTMHGLLMLIGHVSLLLFFTSSIQVNKLENYGMSKSTEGPRSSNTFSLAIPYQSTVIEPCEWNDKCQIEGKP